MRSCVQSNASDPWFLNTVDPAETACGIMEIDTGLEVPASGSCSNLMVSVRNRAHPPDSDDRFANEAAGQLPAL